MERMFGCGVRQYVRVDGAARWFGSVSIGEGRSAGRAVLDGLLQKLDQLQPSSLDAQGSWIRDTKRGSEFHLAHRDDRDAGIDLVVDQEEALLFWLGGLNHADREDGTPHSPWTTVAVDAVAAILRGRYRVSSHYRSSRMVKRELFDVSDGAERLISTKANPLTSWLPSRRPRRIESRDLDYGTVH